MRPEFEYSCTLRTLIENFLEHENGKWRKMQMLFLWAFLLVCACGWMTDTEIDSLFIFFGFGHLYLICRLLVIKSMHERFQLNRFLLDMQEEKRLVLYLRKKRDRQGMARGRNKCHVCQILGEQE